MSDEETSVPVASAPATSATKKKNKKSKKNKQKTHVEADGPNAEGPSTEAPPPLFPTVQSSRTGVERVDFGTNDTLTMLQPIPTAVVSDQLDTVLHAVRQLDNTCSYPAGCRTKVTLIFQECKYCDRRFCMRHGLPEVHGCGEAIRKAERAEFLRPVPVRTRQREEDTRKARERMEQKLKDMQLERRAKPAGQKKK